MDDPLGVASTLQEVEAIAAWGQDPSEPTLQVSANPDVGGDETLCPFPFDEALNDKICIWDGDVVKLRADAIVNSTNEGLNEKTELSTRLHEVAGPELRAECDALGNCRTGDVKVTKAYNLPSRFVFHTVGPRFNKRYRTAAESALYSCTRSTLTEMRERGIRTLGMPSINTSSRNYATADAAPIVLRTIRRFLGQHGASIDRIVLCLSELDKEIYHTILPVYFPRSKTEQTWAIENCPGDIGNQDGEPVIEERKIRIMTGPMSSQNSDEEEGNEAPDSENEDDDDAKANEFKPNVFAEMTGDHDRERRHKLMLRDPKSDESASKQRYYQALLKKARASDLSTIAKMKICAPGGMDREGNRVISLACSNVTPDANAQQVTLAIISAMDSIVNKPYIIVQYMTGTQGSSQGVNLVRDVLNVADDRYKTNLRSIYVVHSSFWTRASSFFSSISSDSGVKDKKKTLPGLRQLFELVSPEQVDVPDYVWKFDAKEFGAINDQSGLIGNGEDL
eukprot:m.125620 g.125620  ORF g.125620 m.125620 type:complete len:508 (-) comp29142_c0_seq1:88-1611(-)